MRWLLRDGVVAELARRTAHPRPLDGVVPDLLDAHVPVSRASAPHRACARGRRRRRPARTASTARSIYLDSRTGPASIRVLPQGPHPLGRAARSPLGLTKRIATKEGARRNRPRRSVAACWNRWVRSAGGLPPGRRCPHRRLAGLRLRRTAGRCRSSARRPRRGRAGRPRAGRRPSSPGPALFPPPVAVEAVGPPHRRPRTGRRGTRAARRPGVRPRSVRCPLGGTPPGSGARTRRWCRGRRGWWFCCRRTWVLLRGHRCCCVRCRVQAEPGGRAVRPARTRRGLLRVGKRWRTPIRRRTGVLLRRRSRAAGGPRASRHGQVPNRRRTAARGAWTASVRTRGVVLVERPARRLRAPLPSCWSGFRIVMALRGRYRRPELRRQTFGRRSLPIDRPVAGCRREGAPRAPDGDSRRERVSLVRRSGGCGSFFGPTVLPILSSPLSPPVVTSPRADFGRRGGTGGPGSSGGGSRTARRAPTFPADCRRRPDRRPTRRVVLVERPARHLRAPRPSCWSGFRIVMALRGRYRGPQVRRQTFGRRSLLDRPARGRLLVGKGRPGRPDGDG